MRPARCNQHAQHPTCKDLFPSAISILHHLGLAPSLPGSNYPAPAHHLALRACSYTPALNLSRVVESQTTSYLFPFLAPPDNGRPRLTCYINPIGVVSSLFSLSSVSWSDLRIRLQSLASATGMLLVVLLLRVLLNNHDSFFSHYFCIFFSLVRGTRPQDTTCISPLPILSHPILLIRTILTFGFCATYKHRLRLGRRRALPSIARSLLTPIFGRFECYLNSGPINKHQTCARPQPGHARNKGRRKDSK